MEKTAKEKTRRQLDFLTFLFREKKGVSFREKENLLFKLWTFTDRLEGHCVSWGVKYSVLIHLMVAC